MAFALLRYTANGSTNTFSVSFSYRSTADVIVKLDGVTQTITTHYTFPTSSQIQFVSMPTNGQVVEIRRATSQSSRLVDYQAGAVIKESDLDNDSIQGFNMAQEAIDITEDALTKDSLDRYDATNKRIINVTDPTSAQDASTKNYVDTKFASDVSTVAASATSAANSATASATSATASASSATSAAASYDSFDDRYLGAKSSDPSVDNDGDALIDGAMYFNTTSNVMKVYDLGNTTWVTIKPTTTEQGHINTVSGISANVTTVAGKATEIGRLGTADAVADMAILGTTDVVADMNTLATADVVADMNTLGTADVVSDMNTLGTADVVSDMDTLAAISANITTVAGVSSDVTTVAGQTTEIGRLGTADAVADMNTLGTADVVSDMNTLATSANVTAMDNVSGSIASVNTVSGSIANVNTAATNITDINTFAVRYRIGSTDPSTSLDAGDLFYNTSDNQMKFYDGTNWVALSADTDVKTKVSANDTTAGFLNGKLTAGANISLTENSDGGNETLAIAVTGSLGGGNYLGNNGEIGSSNADIIRVHAAELNYSGTLTLASTENGMVAGPFSIAGSTILDVQGTLVVL
jgi:hypothetical protein